MPLLARLLESGSCNFAKFSKVKFSTSLVTNQLSTATLSCRPTFIIGPMSIGRVISGRALVHSWPSKEARLRDLFRVTEIRSGRKIEC
jgi:hypothetical protein